MIQSKKISQNFVDPSLFVHYSKEQLKNKNIFLADIQKGKYKWFPAHNYYDKKNVYVPAQEVFLSDDFSDEININGEQITTGAALGSINQDKAFETGFLEVIERDAYIISYLQKRKIKKLKHLSNKIEHFVEYLKRYCLTPYIFDITTDIGVATFMTITLDRTCLGPSINIGLKSGFDIENTIFKSMLESIQSRNSCRLFKEMTNDKLLNEQEVRSTESRQKYWYNVKMIKHLNFWLEDSQDINFDELPKYLQSKEDALNELLSRDYHVFVSDITLPEIKDMGFEVVKVMIPELHPLYLNEHNKYLYSEHAGNIKDDKLLKPHPFL